jgi:hypothetical protein
MIIQRVLAAQARRVLRAVGLKPAAACGTCDGRGVIFKTLPRVIVLLLCPCLTLYE